jgi:hypothetical protein
MGLTSVPYLQPRFKNLIAGLHYGSPETGCTSLITLWAKPSLLVRNKRFLALTGLLPTLACNPSFLCSWAIISRDSSILETNDVSGGNAKIFKCFVINFVKDIGTIGLAA